MFAFASGNEISNRHEFFCICLELLQEILDFVVYFRLCQIEFVLSVETVHFCCTYLFFKQLVVHQEHNGEGCVLRTISTNAQSLQKVREVHHRFVFPIEDLKEFEN